MAQDRPLNVGIIGYGLSAKVFHIPFVQSSPNTALHTIVQRNPPPSPSAAGLSAPHDHPAATHHRSPEPLFADPAVDIVVITTPPDTHFALAESALRSGKHVLVEKPFVPTSSEAQKLAAISTETGRFLCVFQNRRWDVDFLTIQRLLAEKRLGDRVVEFSTHFDRFRPAAPSGTWKASLSPEKGGGPLYDLGTHMLDQVHVLFGTPSTVYAKMTSQRRDGAEDSLTAVLGYEDSGLLVHVRAGVLSAEKKQLRFWVRGSGGSYKKFGMDPQEGHLRAGGSVEDAGFGAEPEPGTVCVAGADGSITEEEFTVEPAGYGALLEGFVAAIRSGKAEDVPVTAGQAADVLRTVEAIRESSRTGAEIKL